MGARMRITTLVTPAVAPSGGVVYDLTTLPVVKADLGITTGTDDLFFKGLISRASAAAASYCNRVFPVETVTDEFFPICGPGLSVLSRDRAPLTLSRWPIVAVTTVTENAVVLVAGTDFRIDYDKGQLIRIDSSGNPSYWPNYQLAITYSAGYATIPYDVIDAVIRMVKNRWFMRTRDSSLRQQAIPGVIEQQFWVATGAEAGAMTPDVVDLLDGYRVPVIT